MQLTLKFYYPLIDKILDTYPYDCKNIPWHKKHQKFLDTI